MRVAFIGLGAVGQELLRYLLAADPPVDIVGAMVAHSDRSRACPVFVSLGALLQARPDIVVECARQHVVAQIGPTVLANGNDMLISSVGALADQKTESAIRTAAKEGGAHVLIPAGALAGIDALASARHVGITNVRYTRRAPRATWVKSGAIPEAAAAALDRPHVVFEGHARDAARRYPKNANVTATVALAGIGFECTCVTLVADPQATSNVHIIEAEGAFGVLRSEMSATPIAGSTSSRIVAGSLARAVLSRSERLII